MRNQYKMGQHEREQAKSVDLERIAEALEEIVELLKDKL